MASQGNAASLSEPRSIVQSLTSKFHATADVAAIGRINQAFERVRASRAENLAVSRDTLHRMCLLLRELLLPFWHRMDEKG